MKIAICDDEILCIDDMQFYKIDDIQRLAVDLTFGGFGLIARENIL